MSAIETVDTFLRHVFSGDLPSALALVAEDAHFVGSRPTPSATNPIFGTHVGPDGAQAFFSAFAQVLQPGAFDVQARFGQGDHVAMYGTLCHTVRSTGRPFASDWALICVVRDGKLRRYHFYEDTEALAQAMN